MPTPDMPAPDAVTPQSTGTAKSTSMDPRERAAGRGGPCSHRGSYDVVIVGGGHNGLVAAAYLARAGRSVLLLERRDTVGGAAVSHRAFPGVEARLSRYSYLVSLLPDQIVSDLGLKFTTRGRRISSYTPTVRGGQPTGLLVDAHDSGRNRAAFAALTGSDREFTAWQRFYGMAATLAERVAPTLIEPLPTAADLERRIADSAVWEAFFERPLGAVIEQHFADDLVRGVVLTDALIGTFTHAHDPSLKQNRCFLYHVIGNGTGQWRVPVGGMGALTSELAASAHRAGAELAVGHQVTAINPEGGRAEVAFRHGDREDRVAAGHVLVGAAPHVLAGLLGEPPTDPPPEGAQLKINMLLRRLPRLHDAATDPREAFSGTFHIAESYAELELAYRQAARGRLPEALPSEIYCHSLTDPSILSAELAGQGQHTLTLFGLHCPARLFTEDHDAARTAAMNSALDQLDRHLREPIRDLLANDRDGRPCIEVKTPLDVQRDLAMPGGHIFHRDLRFPHRPPADQAQGVAGDGRWGVETAHPRVLLCGAGALRGGGVSGIAGHNAAMAVLGISA